MYVHFTGRIELSESTWAGARKFLQVSFYCRLYKLNNSLTRQLSGNASRLNCISVNENCLEHMRFGRLRSGRAFCEASRMSEKSRAAMILLAERLLLLLLILDYTKILAFMDKNGI